MKKNLLAFLLAGMVFSVLACQSTGAGLPGTLPTPQPSQMVLPTSAPVDGSATVTAYVLHLRTAAGTDQTVIYWLRAGDVVELLGECDDIGWRHVKTSGGLTGWVNADYLSKGCP